MDIGYESTIQERYRELFENTSDGLYQSTPEGRLLDVNPAMARIFGYSTPAEMLTGVTDIARDLYADSTQYEAIKQQIAAQGIAAGCEVLSRRRDGSPVWVKLTMRGVRDAQGRIQSYTGMLQDITAQKQAEADLRESETRYRNLAERSPEGILIYMIKDGQLAFINQAGAQLLDNGQPATMIGQRLSDFVHPDYRVRIDQQMQAVTRLQYYNHPHEESVMRRDGQEITVEVTAWPFTYRGQPAIQVIVRDLSAHRRAEKERQRAENERDRLFNFSLDMVCIAGFDGYFKQLNPAWSTTLGWSIEELLSRPWLDFVHPDDHAATRAITEQLCIGKTVLTFENRYRCKDGSYRWLSWNSQPLQEEACIFAVTRDITHYKQSEMAMQVYSDIVNAIPLGLYVYRLEDHDDDHSLRLLQANPAAIRILGSQFEDNVGRTIDEIFPYLRAHNIPQRCADVVRYGRSFAVENFSYQQDNLAATHFAINLFPLPNDCLGILFENITTRKQMEKALLESEKRYRAISELISDYVFHLNVNPDGNVILDWASENFTAITGRSLTHVQESDSWLHIFHPDDVEKALNFLRETIRSGADGEIHCRTFVRGRIRWVSITVRPERAGERTVAILGAVKDISANKQVAEEQERFLAQLREQAQRVQQIINTVPEGVILLDAHEPGTYRVLSANPLGMRDLDVLSEAGIGDVLTHLSGRPIIEILTSPPKGLWHEIQHAGRTFQIMARPLESGAQTHGWVVVIRDLTHQREIERYAQQQERLAAVGQLAAGIAHDFNNIMATIVLYAQLSGRSENLTTRDRERLETINQQAKHASDLIQQILDFSRRAVLERRPLDLLPLVKEQMRILERTLPEDIHLQFTYLPADYTINGDPTRMQQMLMNLVLNARDAMPQGGSLHITLDRLSFGPRDAMPMPAMRPGVWIKITIADTGTGLSPEAQEHLFEPFFTTKEPGKGTGLGLAQVHGIVGAHDGYIHVETHTATAARSGGTTFSIYLPALFTLTPEAEPPDTESPVMGHNEWVLVVEDNAPTRAALVESLEMLNYQVVTAAHGREALELLQQRQAAGQPAIRLVLSDVVMPEMGGVALLRALHEQGIGANVVLMTGHPLEHELTHLRAEYESAAVRLVDWLLKPVNLIRLAEVVARGVQP